MDGEMEQQLKFAVKGQGMSTDSKTLRAQWTTPGGLIDDATTLPPTQGLDGGAEELDQTAQQLSAAAAQPTPNFGGKFERSWQCLKTSLGLAEGSAVHWILWPHLHAALDTHKYQPSCMEVSILIVCGRPASSMGCGQGKYVAQILTRLTAMCGNAGSHEWAV